ncbi:MAG TPA: NAD-dependent protein deacylase [Kiritimatiellae bacterium]|nr:NAD-dependent protein deacylase [Kiritimatiellia bacterium]
MQPDLQQAVRQAARLLGSSRRIAVLSGAGISVSSGIPDFRSQDGLYSDPSNIGIFEIGEFIREPERFFRFAARFYQVLMDARPNTAHEEIARWQQAAQVEVITQNIDDLHEQAGAQQVYHLHGSYRTSRCMRCGKMRPTDELLDDVARGCVPLCHCGGILKPEIVFFGEQLPLAAWSAAQRAIAAADVLLVVGTSLVVYPANMLPRMRSPSTAMIVVNRDPTPADGEAEVVIRGDIVEVFGAFRSVLGG